jgi:hypothetical protein
MKNELNTCFQQNSPRAHTQGCHADVFGRPDSQTMAAGASVTWTHCSVLFEVTWDKTMRVRADAPMCLRGRKNASARTHLPPLPPLPPSPLLSERTQGWIRVDAKKN